MKRTQSASITSSVAIPSRSGFAASFSVTSGANVTTSHAAYDATRINGEGDVEEDMKWFHWFKKPEFYLVTVIYMSSQVGSRKIDIVFLPFEQRARDSVSHPFNR